MPDAPPRPEAASSRRHTSTARIGDHVDGRLVSEPALFAAVATLVFAAKLPLLGTPYYWDEMVWVGFAHTLAERSLWNVLPGSHPPFLFGNRPPGFFLPMAALFKVAGESIRLSHLYVLAFALGGVWFTYRLGKLWFGQAAGILAALFLFLNATYFTQSAMFLSDVPVAAVSVVTVYFAVQRRFAAYWAAAIFLVFMKESAVTVVGAVAAWAFVVRASTSVREAVADAVRYAAPLVPVALFYVWQWRATGHAFMHFARELSDTHYEWTVSALVSDSSSARNQAHRITEWLFFEQGRWAFTAVLAAGALPLVRRRPRELLLVALIVATVGYAFSFSTFLPRYLLPVAPFFCVACAGALVTLLPGTQLRVAAGAVLVAFLVTLLEERPPRANREWDLGYLRVVAIHREAAAFVERELAGRSVLAPFPFAWLLEDSSFGYVSRPLSVVWRRNGIPDDTKSYDVIVAGVPGGNPDLRRWLAERKLPELARFTAGADYVAVYAADARSDAYDAHDVARRASGAER